MALVVNTDTYTSVADADMYFSNRLYSTAWAALSPSNKEASLRIAAKHLDLMYMWLGEPTSSSQPMAWPRNGLYTRNGAEILNTTVPEDIKNAQCELAYQWAQSDQLTPPASSFTADDTSLSNGGIKREKLGPLEREYNTDKPLGFLFGTSDRARLRKVYPLVDMLVKPYVSSLNSSIFKEIRQ